MTYAELVEKARETYESEDTPHVVKAWLLANIIYPTDESEDESMRKALYADIRTYIPNERGDKYIAWLEEQGEKKTDKIEPKFKVGYWIVLPLGIVAHIDSLNSADYQVTTTDGKICDFKISQQDNYRLWTIADAKDGDVLVNYFESGKCIAIFKSIITDDKMYDTEIYCHLINDLFISTSGYSNATWEPATKEQRDLLFQKMKDAGYGWDAKKKELKKIEPKKLDVDEVVEWIDKHWPFRFSWGNFSLQVGDAIDKFKKDFEL